MVKYHMVKLLMVASMIGFGSLPSIAGTKSTPQTAEISFEAKMVAGKKIWSPAETKVTAGMPVTLKVHNTLPEPHGFEIKGYIKPQTIGANETKTFSITPKKSGELIVSCHLHPAHVPAKMHVHAVH